MHRSVRTLLRYRRRALARQREEHLQMIVVGAADKSGEIAAERHPHHVWREALHGLHGQETAARFVANAHNGVLGHNGDPSMGCRESRDAPLSFQMKLARVLLEFV